MGHQRHGAIKKWIQDCLWKQNRAQKLLWRAARATTYFPNGENAIVIKRGKSRQVLASSPSLLHAHEIQHGLHIRRMWPRRSELQVFLQRVDCPRRRNHFTG